MNKTEAILMIANSETDSNLYYATNYEPLLFAA